MENMSLPLFTAEASLYAVSEHHVYFPKMKLIDRLIIRPQDISSCLDSCQDECCSCPQGPEGPIEDSCLCRQPCLSNCYSRCSRIEEI